MRSKVRGFTLVELIMVMVIVGVLGLVVVPRFSGTGDLDGYFVRDQLISATRLAQQRAMYERDSCFRLNLGNASFGIQRSADGGATWVYLPVFDSSNADDNAQQAYVRATSGAPLSVILYFDGLGNTASDCNGTLLDATTTITLVSLRTLSLNICATGYATKNAC